jgi:hypothetical protein
MVHETVEENGTNPPFRLSALARYEEEGSSGRFERYRTTELEYQCFEGKLKKLVDEGHEVRVAVESTGNTRYFKRRVERVGVPVVVINTMKFKVVTESVKKTDRRGAATIAEFLEKDMLPEARLCSTESEELRRVLKTRTRRASGRTATGNDRSTGDGSQEAGADSGAEGAP